MNDSKQNNRKLSLGLAVIGLLMFGFGFALVPLYDVFCDVTGLNGKTENRAAAAVSQEVDTSRTILLEFVTNTQSGEDWQFKPETRKLRVHPGQVYTVSFQATNMMNSDVVAQAIPSVAPGLAASHLKKTECFCFSQQTFLANETKHMPVTFYLDGDVPEDVSVITLSYTLFKLGDQVTQNNPNQVKSEI